MHATPSRSLTAWLHELDQTALGDRDEWLLGGSGHLLLNPEEEATVTAQLCDGVLPRLFERLRTRSVCVLTGLAPGADLLFTRVVSDWLVQAGIAHRTLGLLPLPPPLLLEDWVLVAEASGNVGNADIQRQRQRLEIIMRECSTLIDLLPQGTADARLQSSAFRQSQYRRLAACLAQRSDVLVAILRRENPLRPGGTAEVVDWRRNPHKVPQDYSTLTPSITAAHSQLEAGRRRLILIDPEARSDAAEASTASLLPAASAQSFAQRATEALQAGNYVHCYDLAQQARARGFDTSRLQYLSLLALVNAGSTALAWRRYRELGLHGDERDEDWLALKGRLLKDLTLAGDLDEAGAGEDHTDQGAAQPDDATTRRRKGFLRAAQAYLAAYRLTGGHFTAINAATMFQLAGDTPRARALATDVVNLITEIDAADTGCAETERYYRRVTEAEAALLLGDLSRYRRSLNAADALLRSNLNARSRTRAQLRLLCEALHLDPGLPALLWLPEVIRVRRRDDSDLDATVADDCTGALAFVVPERIADLGAAEALLARGAHLHVVLPAERSEVLGSWAAAFGDAASARLEALLERAGDVTVARGFVASETQWSQGYVSAVADGLAALDAARLGCELRELWLGSAVTAPSAAPPAAPRGTPLRNNGQRRFAGLIFADIVGFRRLSDSELPRFWEVVMGSMARIIDRFGARVLFRGTWGDALHLVTEDALTAAELAVAIQARFEQLRASESGALAEIELRLAAHFAPVFTGHDPIVKANVYYGSQLAFTARIEPITPPGMIFVTELFAAALMLDAAQAFTLDYVGELALAKRYGSYRIFSLRAAERLRDRLDG